MSLAARMFLFTSVAFMLSAAATARPQPEKTDGYKPFYIVSTKLDDTMSSYYIEAALMCRSTWEKIEVHMDLLKNYDLISTAGDHSMSITRFSGLQGGEPVVVDLMVTSSDNILRAVWVNNEPMLRCPY